MDIGPKNPNPAFLYAQRRQPTMRQVGWRQLLGNIAAWIVAGTICFGGIIGAIYLAGLAVNWAWN